MNKKQLFKNIALSAIGLVGGKPALAAEEAIEHVFHRDDDPTNDLDETADALADAVIKAVAATEGVAQKDLVNDPVILALRDNLKATIKLIPLVLVKKAA